MAGAASHAHDRDVTSVESNAPEASALVTEHVEISVGEMTCAHCPPLVAKALKQVDGVIDARVSLASQTASVDFDPARTRPKDVLEAIRRAGYVPGVASARISPSNRSSACCRPTLRKGGNQEFSRKQPWL